MIKSEIRSLKQIPNLKFKFGSFGFVSDFDIRASSFLS